MRKLIWMLLAVAALPLWAAQAAEDRVVAVVNDQVLTLSQLEARTVINLRQAGLAKPTPAQVDAVRKRTLATLIDEELQRQYADRAGIAAVSKADLEKARKAAISNLGVAEWEALVKGYPAAADDKLAAEVRWQRILASDVRPRVNIGTLEVDQLIEKLAQGRHVLEREISMILLNAGDAGDDKGQLAKLQEIRDRIMGGASFADEARAYSDDSSAVKGGNLGWFSNGELNPDLEAALDKLQPGQISEPIRTPMGWHLVKLENVRTTRPVGTDPVPQFDLYLLAAGTPSGTDVKTAETKLDKAIGKLKKPEQVRDAFKNADKALAEFPQSRAIGWVDPSDLQEELADALKGAKPGQWTKPVRAGDGVVRMYVADVRNVMPAKLEDYRERVSTNLINSKMELASRRFMRELRQKAFVDVRL